MKDQGSNYPLWEYKLADDIHMLQENVLIKQFPLRIFRLTNLSAMLLKVIASGLNVSQEILPKVVDFAEHLARCNVLRREIPPSLPPFTPSISVIIPVKDRPREIDTCLHSIFNCNYPQDKLEVIVIDDGSEDSETARAASRYPVRLIELQENRGQSACRNLGVKYAQGDNLAFTDSDCEVSPHWLLTLARCFMDPQVALVGGGVHAGKFDTLLDFYEEDRSPLSMGDMIMPIEKNSEVSYVPTCNLLVKKEAFLKAGGFNEELHVGEDVDLIWRVLERGYKGWYVPQGFVWHHHRNKLFPFLKRRAQYAGSEALLSKTHNNLNKYLYLPLWHIPLFAALLAAIFFKSFTVTLAGAGFIFLLEFIVKLIKIKTKGIKIHALLLFRAIMQSYYTTIRFTTALLTRYYFWMLPLAAVLLPGGWIILAIPLLSSLLEYRRAYKLSFPRFMLCYLLEMMAYSFGYLYGCIKQKQFKMLLLSIYFRKKERWFTSYTVKGQESKVQSQNRNPA